MHPLRRAGASRTKSAADWLDSMRANRPRWTISIPRPILLMVRQAAPREERGPARAPARHAALRRRKFHFLCSEQDGLHETLPAIGELRIFARRQLGAPRKSRRFFRRSNAGTTRAIDRKSTRLNSSHIPLS